MVKVVQVTDIHLFGDRNQVMTEYSMGVNQTAGRPPTHVSLSHVLDDILRDHGAAFLPHFPPISPITPISLSHLSDISRVFPRRPRRAGDQRRRKHTRNPPLLVASFGPNFER